MFLICISISIFLWQAQKNETKRTDQSCSEQREINRQKLTIILHTTACNRLPELPPKRIGMIAYRYRDGAEMLKCCMCNVFRDPTKEFLRG
jgi:hypothetical protein